MGSNYWLFGELKILVGVEVEQESDDMLVVNRGGEEYRVYVPDSAEYLVTVDIVDKAIELGANVLSYPASWCSASKESAIYGAKKGVKVMPHVAFFKMLGK